MANYFTIETSSGEIEIETDDVMPDSGVGRTGLSEKVASTAQATLTQAFDIIRTTAQAFMAELKGATELPDEMELSFGVKASGDVGNFVIAKATAEANFSVKMKWTSKQFSSATRDLERGVTNG